VLNLTVIRVKCTARQFSSVDYKQHVDALVCKKC